MTIAMLKDIVVRWQHDGGGDDGRSGSVLEVRLLGVLAMA